MSKLFLPGSPEWEETLAQVKTRDLPLSFPFATIPIHCHSCHRIPLNPAPDWAVSLLSPWQKAAQITHPGCHPPQPSQTAESTPGSLPKLRKSEYHPARQRGNFRSASSAVAARTHQYAGPVFVLDAGCGGQRRIAATAQSRGHQLMKILNPVFRSTAPQTPA